MDEQKFQNIIDRIAEGTANQEEVNAYINWLKQMSSEFEQDILVPFSKEDFNLELKSKIDSNIRWTTKDVHNTLKPVRLFKSYWKYIAAAIVILAMGIRLIMSPSIENGDNSVSAMERSYGAVLTLSDGTKIDLQSGIESKHFEDGKALIVSNKEGEIVYTDQQSKAIEKKYEKLNTLETSIGKTYKIRLPDGSRVWINAASKLSYPATFSAKERSVILEGEAYFEIANDKSRPFTVTTSTQKIVVTGTQFNIQSYSNNKYSKTTLFHGAVQVESGDLHNVVNLSPGEQLFHNANGIHVKTVDLNGVAAWKMGVFDFENDNLPDVLRTLSRWYDFDYEEIQNPILAKQLFNGRISKNSSLKEVLELLELTGAVRFKQEGRRVIIMK